MKSRCKYLKLFSAFLLSIILLFSIAGCKNYKLKRDTAPKQAQIVFDEAENSIDTMELNYDKDKNLKKYLRIRKNFQKAKKYYDKRKFRRCIVKSYKVKNDVNSLLLDLLIETGDKYYQAKMSFDKFTNVKGSIYTPDEYDRAKMLFEDATILKDEEHNYKEAIKVCEELKKLSDAATKLAEMKRCAEEISKLEFKVYELETINPDVHLMDDYIDYVKMYQQSTDYFDQGDLESAYNMVDDMKYVVDRLERRTNKEKAVNILFELDEKVKNFKLEYGKKLDEDSVAYLNDLFELTKKYVRIEEYTKAIELSKDVEGEMNRLKESIKRDEEVKPYKKYE